jgi:integrase
VNQQKRNPKLYLKPHDYLELDQVRKVLHYVHRRAAIARAHGTRRAVLDSILIELLLNSGLRGSELCALKICDLPAAHGKPAIYVSRGKGSKPRTIEISSVLAARITEYTKTERKWAKPRSWAFVNERGRRLKYWSLYRKIKRIGRAVGLPWLHPHTFRHTYAVHLRSLSQDSFFIRDQLGHTDMNTTSIYSKTLDTERRRYVESLTWTG